MKNIKLNYISLLIIFLLFIFGSNINRFLIAINPNLSSDNITSTYCQSIESDYNLLIESVELAKNSPLSLIISKVKYRNIYKFREELTIYKGYQDKISKGSAVITNDGLIGVIKNTFSSSSIVELITNPKSNISVKINNAYGVLKVVNGLLVVTDLSNYDQINVDDLIYTSGIGNLKGDIYIGKVSNVSLNSSKIEKIISVDIAGRLDNINYVYVIGD